MAKKDRLLKSMENVRNYIHVITEFIQYLLACIIIVGIIVQLSGLPSSLSELFKTGTEGFHDFLEYVIDMVIGIELIHLLCHPNLDNVVEVLLIAITRETVLYTEGPLAMLTGVAAIAILFAIRKYLFIDKLDRHDEDFTEEELAAERLRVENQNKA